MALKIVQWLEIKKKKIFKKSYGFISTINLKYLYKFKNPTCIDSSSNYIIYYTNYQNLYNISSQSDHHNQNKLKTRNNLPIWRAKPHTYYPMAHLRFVFSIFQFCNGTAWGSNALDDCQLNLHLSSKIRVTRVQGTYTSSFCGENLRKKINKYIAMQFWKIYIGTNNMYVLRKRVNNFTSVGLTALENVI